MFWILYDILFLIGYLLILPHYLIRMWRRGGYARDFMQRLGVYSPETLAKIGGKPRIWIHGVSVGEIYVVLRFVEEFKKHNLGVGFVVTTTTSTGHKVARERMDADDVLLYYPVDFTPVVHRALKVVNPMAVILTECELWPNLIRQIGRKGVPLFLVNGRVSDASYSGYRQVKLLTRRIFRHFRLLTVQTATDGDRLVSLGAVRERTKVLGSAKYDVAESETADARVARSLLDRAGIHAASRIILGGSTWPGEERILIDIYKRLRPTYADLKLVLVPRHAERRGEVEAEILSAGLTCVRRTDLSGDAAGGAVVSADVLLVDSTGELKSFYACADVIFVGKSLTKHGGQNIVEPALYGKAIVFGPNMENFLGVTADFLEGQAALQVRDAAGLEQVIRSLLESETLRRELGERARRVFSSKTGAVSRSVSLILTDMGMQSRADLARAVP